MDTRSRRLWRGVTIVVIALVVLVVGAVVYAATTDGQGDITDWIVKDRSGDPSPVAAAIVPLAYSANGTSATITTTERRVHHPRHRGRITRVRVKNRSTAKHRSRSRSRGRGSVWCRTARAEGTGGNALFPSLVKAGISQRFCWNTATHRITELGALNTWAVVTETGTYFLWTADSNQAESIIRGAGDACDGGNPPLCWEYEYRRGVYGWHQVIPHVGPISINRCVSITMRGTGKVIVGHPSC